MSIDLKSSSEVAKMLNRTRYAVAKMCQRGVFPGAKKIGKTWLIPTHEIELGRDIKRGNKGKG